MDLNTSAEGNIQKAAKFTGRVQNIDAMGEIYFVLLTENEISIWPNRNFKLQGHGISLTDKTDGNGEFRHSPVEFGEYQLEVGDAIFKILAIQRKSPPFRVNVPYNLLPDQSKWDSPTDEESNEVGLE